LELLRRLVQIPSVNPMAGRVEGPHVGEARLTAFLQQQCESLGLPWLRQRVHPGRDNLLALLRGNPSVEDGGQFLLWDVHQDTVPVDGMTIDPFGGEIRDGRLYGRGACDVKGAMAAILTAISRLASANQASHAGPTVVIAFTVNEECGFTGAQTLCNLWRSDRTEPADIVPGKISAEDLFPRAPDAAIVAEPTDLQVVVAHQGVARWQCRTTGRAAHTSRPDAGINAVYGMAQVVQAIEQYHAKLQRTGPDHPLCGRPSVCVSTFHGGVGVNTVPESATIDIDRRLGPDENAESAYDEMVRFIAQHADVGRCKVEHDPPFMYCSGLSDGENHSLAARLADLVHTHDRPSQLVGVPYATDAVAIAAAGIPTVVFGPGSIAQAHTADEFINIEELRLASDIFFDIAQTSMS
ncbi:MAG TPA: M20 family metallopeptidase, partial [Lacipirellulaceae bacterium]|nr:M20 family metallopeptidase [Lacipirellulaceae bacterium]